MKKQDKKKKSKQSEGFTLVELLAVLVIMGIIMGITVPSVAQIATTQRAQKYSYHEKIVKQATDAYVDQYRDTFQEEQGSCACYNIPYHLLVDEGLVNEEDVTCTVTEDTDRSVILAYPLDDSGHNFRYEYYLTCTTKEDGTIINKPTQVPSGCCGVNGNFVITDAIIKYNDENGAFYPQSDNNWTKENVYQRFSATNPYMAGIKGYEYSLDGGNSWTLVGGDRFTFSTDMNKRVQVRAVDNDGNHSSVKMYDVRIDKTKPSANFNITGTRNNSEWYSSDVKIGVTGQTDGFGSGVASASVDIPEIKNNTPGTTVTLTVTDKVGNTATKTTTIKVDKTKPTISVSAVQKGTTTVVASGVTSKYDLVVTAKATNSPISGQTIYYCQGNNCNPTTKVTGNLTLTKETIVCFQSKSGANIASDKVCYNANIHKQETIPVNVGTSSTVYSSNKGYSGWGWGADSGSTNRSGVCVDLTDVQTLELSVYINGNASSDQGNANVYFAGSAGVYSGGSTVGLGGFTGFSSRYAYYHPANTTVSLKGNVSTLKGSYCFYVSTSVSATNDFNQNGTRSTGSATIRTATLYY